MHNKVRSGLSEILLVLTLVPFSLLYAQPKKPYLVKRTKTVILDGKESYRVPMVEGVTSSGVKFQLQMMTDSSIERRLFFPDGTYVRARDSLKIKTTMPGQPLPPERVCNSKALDTTTIHGVKADLVEVGGGMKGWLAPSLGCIQLRGFHNLPSTPGYPVQQNRIETDSIEFKDPPKEWISVANLEELPTGEFTIRALPEKIKSEAYLNRLREKHKEVGIDNRYYQALQGKKQ